MMGIGHNFLHQRDHVLRYALDLSVFGHHDWRISHVLSHHSYPVSPFRSWCLVWGALPDLCLRAC